MHAPFCNNINNANGSQLDGFLFFSLFFLSNNDNGTQRLGEEDNNNNNNVHAGYSFEGKTEEEEVRVLERGDYFGEQALLREECRSANIIAMAPGVECLTLNRE